MKQASMIHCRLMVAVNIALLLGGTATAQFDDVRAGIKRKLTAQNVPSLAVAVARDGEIVWEEGFGWADREKRVRATEHTMYSLASISKPITATGLMVLVQRGQVDLDRPINDYLGDAKLNGRVFDASKATVRRVANHTAGLPLHYQFFYRDEPYRRPNMDETIRRYANLVTPPGERSQYSNLGFGLIDYVIERVSGESYPDFMREEVFIPLGLTRMSVDIGPGLEEFTATRYGRDGTPIPFYDFDHPGGSAVFASAHDLVRFGMLHLKNGLSGQQRILTDQSIDEMHRPTAMQQNGRGYGIGWGSTTNDRGLRTLSHSGGMGGVSTTLRLFPELNTVVVVLCNSSSGLPAQIATEIVAVLAPKKAEVAVPDAADPPSPEPSQTGPQFKPMPELDGTWSGEVSTYEGALPITFVIRRSGEVFVQLGDQPWTLLDQAEFSGDVLRGVFAGDLATGDANRRPYLLRLEVRKRANVLNGSLIAMSLPGKRVGNALTHWIEVQRN